jgi:vitamin B12 transporter
VKKLETITVLVGLSVFSIHAAAAELADEIMVTATRTAQTANESLVPVHVISRNQIEQSQAKSIEELLTGLAGIDSSVSGGYGKSTNFYLRGTGSGQVLVLIDGVRVGSATLGSTQFESLPVSEIDRIEIVRGPASSLYGSDAIGGVIQIFTRRSTKPLQLEAEAGYGTYDTGSVGAGVSGESNDVRYSLRASRFHTGGFDAQRNLAPTPFGPTQYLPDRDGYTNTAASLNLSRRFVNGITLEAAALESIGDTESDGFFARTRNEQRVISAKAGISPLSAWRSQLMVGTHLDAADNYYTDDTLGSRIETRRETAGWQNDFTLAEKQIITAGIDSLTEEVSGTLAYSNTKRDNTAGYLQYLGELGAISLQLGGRHDRNSAYGNTNTGQAILGFRLSTSLRLSASHGTAFKAPSFNDLYWPADSYTDTASGITYISVGNHAVQPEESRSSEIGLDYRPITRMQFRINAFETDIRNLIGWNTTLTAPNTYTTMPENITRAHINGVEIQLHADVAGWSTRTAYTWLDPRDEATGNILPRRTQNTFRLDMDRNIDQVRVGAGWLVQGGRYDDVDNTVYLGGYGVINLRAQYSLAKTWWLHARLDNVADKQYETAATFNSPGRSLFVSLGYQSP